MDHFLQELRYSRRMLTRAPGFAVVAVLTLAMGIGATTAIFTAVNAVFLRPLPYPDADRLVFVWGYRAQPDRQLPISLPVALEVESQDRVFDRVGAWTSAPDTRFSLYHRWRARGRAICRGLGGSLPAARRGGRARPAIRTVG